MEKFHTMTPEQRAPVFEAILIWCALERPSCAAPMHVQNKFTRMCRESLKAESFDITRLLELTLDNVQNVLVKNLLSVQTIGEIADGLPMDFEDVAKLAAHLGFNIDKDITIDAAFAEMYTGAGIEKIVYEAKLDTYRNEKGEKGIDEFRFSDYSKTAEKRLWLAAVAGKLGTPKAVKQLWKDTLE